MKRPLPHASVRPGMSGGFLAIIIFKFTKASAFLLFGIAALRFSRWLTLQSSPIEFADFLGVSRDNELVRRASALIAQITPGQATAIGVAAMAISLVFFAEGTFLAARKWWSTYFTIVLTALGLPLELFETARRPAVFRNYVLLAINIAILTYLWIRRNEFRER